LAPVQALYNVLALNGLSNLLVDGNPYYKNRRQKKFLESAKIRNIPTYYYNPAQHEIKWLL